MQTIHVPLTSVMSVLTTEEELVHITCSQTRTERKVLHVVPPGFIFDIFVIVCVLYAVDLAITYSRSVKHAARGPHVALCKHACGPQKDTVIWEFLLNLGIF